MRTTIAAFAFFSIAAAAFAQTDYSKVEIKVTRVSGNIYMLEGAGGNIGVSAGEDGVVIVDDQFAPLAPKIRAALKGIVDKPIRFILNTHFHGDHTGGNEDFGKEATIIAQSNVRKRLASGSTIPGREAPPAAKSALPVITFDDKVSVYVNGEEIRAIHVPHGHTDGDSVIWFTKSNVVHMGDDFFNGNFPFVDQANGGSVKGLIAAVEQILSMVPDDVKVIPGHGKLSDKAGLRAFLDMLKGTTAAVQSAIAAGKSFDDMKTEKVLAAWDSWGKGFIKPERWLKTLTDELTAK